MLVRLSDDGGCYVDDAGDRYVRVSRVLADRGLVRGFYRHDNRYRDRGRAVHFGCELVNRAIIAGRSPDQALKPDSIDERINPYIEGYLKFLRDVVYLPSALEIALGSIHGFAGTIDIVGQLNGDLSIIDIKTGESIDPAVDYQTAAYEVLWHENNPKELIKKRFALQLRRNATYKLHRMSLPAEEFLKVWDQYPKKA